MAGLAAMGESMALQLGPWSALGNPGRLLPGVGWEPKRNTRPHRNALFKPHKHHRLHFVDEGDKPLILSNLPKNLTS